MTWIKAILLFFTGLFSTVARIWKKRDDKAKRQRETLERIKDKIDSDADTADLQSDIDDLLNGL